MRSWPSPHLPVLDGQDGVSAIKVHDTVTGGPLDLAPDRHHMTMYVCGITPYDATHIGHAATYLLFDVLNRVARDAGRTVRYVQNVTDVDDPLLERAAATGEDWRVLAERETELFREDMTALRVLAPAEYVGAVESVPAIAKVVARLLDLGAAYRLDDDVYFSVAAGGRLGEISHLPVDEMLRLSAERGGDPDRPGKKDPLDCLLWQGERPDNPAWDSPVGRGRPGWHVECAAIAMQHLGTMIDVQGGGDDLVFPHHELGADEAGVLTGQWPFADAFVHQAAVAYQGHKMSKSRGNLVFISRLRADGVDPMAIRLAVLDHRHTAAWEWQDSEIERAAIRLASWRAGFARAAAESADPLIAELRQTLRNCQNTPEAFTAVDAWCERPGTDATAPASVAKAVDALLGIN